MRLTLKKGFVYQTNVINMLKKHPYPKRLRLSLRRIGQSSLYLDYSMLILLNNLE